MDIDVEERPKELVRKPYVLNGECWSHSSRSLSCTVRAKKGLRCLHFTDGETEVQREEGNWSRVHKVNTASLTGTFSVYLLNSGV